MPEEGSPPAMRPRPSPLHHRLRRRSPSPASRGRNFSPHLTYLVRSPIRPALRLCPVLQRYFGPQPLAVSPVADALRVIICHIEESDAGQIARAPCKQGAIASTWRSPERHADHRPVGNLLIENDLHRFPFGNPVACAAASISQHDPGPRLHPAFLGPAVAAALFPATGHPLGQLRLLWRGCGRQHQSHPGDPVKHERSSSARWSHDRHGAAIGRDLVRQF